MKVETSVERFHKEWQPTGDMIREGKYTFIQTYTHPRYEGKYTQRRIQTLAGTRIEMTEVERIAA